MTTHTAQPVSRVRTKNVTIGLVAATLAAAVAYGVAVLAFEEDSLDRSPIRGVGTGQVGSPWEQHAKPATFSGTEQEWRAQMHGR